MSEAMLFASDRTFEIWAYNVSHSELLLRSNKSSDRDSRVDILFKNVKYISIKTVLHGMCVEIVSRDDKSILPTYNGLNSDNIYEVISTSIKGYIVASSFFMHEDSLDFYEPSQLLSVASSSPT